mmetsp:Transcript_23051/g.54477  ORF Transcript_23051/g.54477 Transcript_23051/m.54477 type:complete len:84 (-) Transcript_23051:25-276(-)
MLSINTEMISCMHRRQIGTWGISSIPLLKKRRKQKKRTISEFEILDKIQRNKGGNMYKPLRAFIFLRDMSFKSQTPISESICT